MVYGREPDWLTLRDVPLYSSENTKFTLIHITEGLVRWQEEQVDPYLAPGEVHYGLHQDEALLTAALGWTANMIAGGVLGNYSFELLNKLLE
jgi:hypothetical protein